MAVEIIKEMLGVVFVKTDGARFETTDGRYVEFYHEQDCCEIVEIAEVHGDLEDLLNAPIVQAECVTEEGTNDSGTYTWTFYKFATTKGSVTVRWVGESNGYYSESVRMRTNLTEG